MSHFEVDTLCQSVFSSTSKGTLTPPIKDMSRHAIKIEDPTLLEIRRVYDTISSSFLEERKNPNGLFNKFIWPVFLNQIGDVRDQQILDVGCGPGVVSNRLATKGALVGGIDISAPMLRTAHDNYGQNVSFMEANVENLPFADRTFDKVVGLYVLNHLGPAQLQTVFAEVYRVLKKGGRFIFLEPHPDRNQLYFNNSGKNGSFPDGWYGEVYPETKGVHVPCFYRNMDTWEKTVGQSPFHSNVSPLSKDLCFFAPTSENTSIPGLSEEARDHYRTNRVLIANLVK